MSTLAQLCPDRVMIASGCGGTGRELAPYLDLDGAVLVTRSVTRDARLGEPWPRVVETPSGLAHRIGLENPGIAQFLASELPVLVRAGVRTVVSVAAGSLGEYAELARALADAPGVHGVEVNVSSPEALADVFDAREPFHVASVVATVRREVPADLPVLVKLRPEAARVAETARAVHEAGASAVVVGNALPAVLPDGRAAGLSGPALRPVTLRCVLEVVGEVPAVPVVASGGVASAADARHYLDAGAQAVQVGSALLRDPTVVRRLTDELKEER